MTKIRMTNRNYPHVTKEWDVEDIAGINFQTTEDGQRKMIVWLESGALSGAFYAKDWDMKTE